MVELKNPIMLALDVDDAETAIKLTQVLGPKVGAVKVGPRLIVRYGATLIQKLASTAHVFLDHKFFDIPSTMVAAVQAAFDAGASFATVHAWSGKAALETLASLEETLNRQRPFQILCVTVLTSFEQSSLPPLLSNFSIEEHVLRLSQLVQQSGLTGLVCSPHEIGVVRRELAHGFIVTPGIRMPSTQLGTGPFEENTLGKLAGREVNDQKRVLTPKAAIQAGASALVIGRPILNSADPGSLIEDILAQIK